MRASEHSPEAPGDLLTGVLRWLSAIAAVLRRSWGDQVELQERWLLRQRPWEEDLVHWYDDGHELHLHGAVVPHGRRSHSITSTGWCPRGGSHVGDADSDPGR